MDRVKLEGAGPFALPAVQSSSASALDENVQMTLRVLVDGEWASVRTQMTQKVTDALASQLVEASTQARANARKG